MTQVSSITVWQVIFNKSDTSNIGPTPSNVQCKVNRPWALIQEGIPYSGKVWQALNLANWLLVVIGKI